MVPLLLVLLLILILFGGGFAVQALWYVAIAVLVLWLIGFVARPKGSGGRWYRW
ncbi:hydrophobic protein [Streptomyces sp. NPDC090082]|uniref:hydrophobic protein n=1 Tax=unclassified Streptomyces TaxID=2593676 RepID=UPI0037FF26F6